MSSFSRSQRVAKPATFSTGGVVAAQHVRAAEAGAAVLAEGGDAVDAAVAVSFAMGVLEPWMSGPAGGGAMMVWRADEGRAVPVWYGMRAPAELDPADYPLSGDGRSSDLFPWPAVVGDRNVEGASAVAVPGLVDGIGLAHERWGRMPWRDLLAPAIRFAREGLEVDWYAALIIASATRSLARDPDAAALFLEDGRWPTIAPWTSVAEQRIPFPRMADTLDALARGGRRELYEGAVGEALARDVRDKGGSLAHADLAAYRARFEDPLEIPAGAGRLFAVPGLTAGPTLADAIRRLGDAEARRALAPGERAAGLAAALGEAYAERLATMGDGESPRAPGCTTHFSIVDRHGNMVAMTQTLLSVFGARVVSPATGLLLNNGIMWFDPEPGRPNSLGPGRTCLMNVCPVIGEVGETRFAIGGSGGRKILPAVAQLALFMIEDGLDLDAAFHAPRFDVSGGATLIADEAMPAATLDALRARFSVATAPRTVYPNAFACPAGVSRNGGMNAGATEIMSPWGDAVAEPEVS